MDNVFFYGRKPVEQMPEFYVKADAMLVTMKDDVALNLTLPGKVQSYMAAGKPIIGAADGEVDRIIKMAECGYCGKAEDAVKLAENIRYFIKNSSNERRVMGENAKAFYTKYFEKKKCIDKLEKGLLFIINERDENSGGLNEDFND